MQTFTKSEKVMFAEVVEGFQNLNLTAKMMEKWSPGTQGVARSGGSFRYILEDQAEVTTGLDITGQIKDKTENTVAVTLGEQDIYNSPWQFTAFDANDPMRKQRAIQGGIKRLSSYLDTLMQETIVKQSALVGSETVDITKYDQLAKGDQFLSEIECFDGDTHMLLPPRIARFVNSDVANRTTLSGTSQNVYETGRLLDVNGMQAYKANVTNFLAGNAATAPTVAGANQNKELVAWRSDKDVNPLAANEVDDHRYQVLNVSNANLVNGDVFTIDNVNRIGIDTKKDTNTPMTFRVISGGGTNAPVISPAIVSDGAYQNVSAVPADTAPITIVNTADSNPVVYSTKGSCIWVGAEFNVDDLQGSMAVDTYTTDSGITILFARQGEINQLGTTYRCSIWGKPNLIDPMKAGILLPRQAAEIG